MPVARKMLTCNNNVQHAAAAKEYFELYFLCESNNTCLVPENSSVDWSHLVNHCEMQPYS